ncbi:hypothetical protein B0T16DRAFT_73327 [Cercophora newfieldiana]|uniref:Hydrophobin n=1 Tax=Cercophora newfieldiana TaxID=92897 RepID=A0AA39YGK7_9PEZI|nr:hypothetical protein B0T16DRAFT_73327 [Cercophora newfieldiana]
MHLFVLLVSITSSFSLAVAQDTSRLRSRTSTLNAACTNIGTAVTATSTFAPLLAVHLEHHDDSGHGHDDECPRSALLDVHYHNENDVGCCTQSAVLTTAAGGQLACCPCGATCTGAIPSMVDWTFSAGQFITTTGIQQQPRSQVRMIPRVCFSTEKLTANSFVLFVSIQLQGQLAQALPLLGRLNRLRLLRRLLPPRLQPPLEQPRRSTLDMPCSLRA